MDIFISECFLKQKYLPLSHFYHLLLQTAKEIISSEGTLFHTINYFLLSWGHCVSGISKLEIGLRNSILEFVQNFAKNSFPQVSQFFSVCLVRPTYSHCWPHWT